MHVTAISTFATTRPSPPCPPSLPSTPKRCKLRRENIVAISIKLSKCPPESWLPVTIVAIFLRSSQPSSACATSTAGQRSRQCVTRSLREERPVVWRLRTSEKSIQYGNCEWGIYSGVAVIPCREWSFYSMDRGIRNRDGY